MNWMWAGNNRGAKEVVLMEQFGMQTRIYSGAGAVSALAGFGAKRVFLVTDPYFYSNGTAARVAEACGAECVEFFSDVRPDPTVELAAAGTARLKEFRPDLVVALGGGSAMVLNTLVGDALLPVETLLVPSSKSIVKFQPPPSST